MPAKFCIRPLPLIIKMKTLLAIFFVFAILIQCYSQKQHSYYTLKDLEKIGVDSIKRLSLQKEVIHKRTLPKIVKNLPNIELLSLRPPVKKLTKYIGDGPCGITYMKSKLKKLPDWIVDLKTLRIIDLIGNPKLDLIIEINKISKITTLEILAIETDELNDQLLQQLIILKQIKELHIKHILTNKDSIFMEKLKAELPNCVVGCSFFADYCDGNY